MTPKNWREVKLGEICEFAYGKSLPADARSGSGFPVFGSNGQVGFHREALTAGETIIVGRKGSFGEVHFSPGPCSPIDTTYYITEKQTNAYLPWLARRLRCLGLDRLNRAAAIPGLNRADAYRQRLLLPPLPEQKRIAGFLDAAEALRAKRREALAQLDTLLQSTFLDMFGDPVTNPNIPSGVMTELVTKFIDYRGKSPEKCGAGIPLITAKIVKGMEVKEPEEFIPNEIYDAWMRRGIPSPGDVIITTEAPMGEVALVPSYKAAYAQRLLVLQPDKTKAQSIYLMWALTMPFVIQQLRQRSTGSTVTGIRSKEFKKVRVPLPPLELQHRFAAIVESVERQKDRMRAHLAELDALFASLQSRAFSGTL